VLDISRFYYNREPRIPTVRSNWRISEPHRSISSGAFTEMTGLSEPTVSGLGFSIDDCSLTLAWVGLKNNVQILTKVYSRGCRAFAGQLMVMQAGSSFCRLRRYMQTSYICRPARLLNHRPGRLTLAAASKFRLGLAGLQMSKKPGGRSGRLATLSEIQKALAQIVGKTKDPVWHSDTYKGFIVVVSLVCLIIFGPHGL